MIIWNVCVWLFIFASEELYGWYLQNWCFLLVCDFEHDNVDWNINCGNESNCPFCSDCFSWKEDNGILVTFGIPIILFLNIMQISFPRLLVSKFTVFFVFVLQIVRSPVQNVLRDIAGMPADFYSCGDRIQ